MVYRDAPPAPAARVAEPGLVADMVRQFADPYAFLRELVQNGLDAGATRLDVRIERDPQGTVRTSVTDDGSGMARADIEGALLSLFTSSKENDATKIGKYGVGFVSVFAIEPTVVLVETRTEAEAWLVRLYPDHAYDLLAPRSPLPARGTCVTLVQRMNDACTSQHVARSLAALRTWCRHAHVEVRVTILDARSHEAERSVVVNEPFALATLVGISAKVHDARIEVGAGRPEPGTALPLSFTGYYNRGLTLFEAPTAEPGLDGLHVKIESSRLLHTISRDAVKRNADLDWYLAAVPGLVTGRLWDRIVARSQELATALASDVAAGGEVDPGRIFAYGELLAVARTPIFGHDDLDRLVVPLVAPIRGASTMAVRDLGTVTVWVSTTMTPLVGALADRGIPVVVSAAMQSDFGSAIPVTAAWSLLRLLEADPKERAMLDEVRKLLAVAGARCGRIALAAFDGTRPLRGYRVTDVRTAMSVVIRAEPHGDAGWGRSAVLLLDGHDAVVRLARRRARTDPKIAAHLLARALLLRTGPLAVETVDVLLEAAGRG